MTAESSPSQFAMLWDVDGTLVDTGDLHFQAWQKLSEERKFPFSRADFERTFGRRNPEILREWFADHLNEAEIAALGDEKEAAYREAARHGVELLPGVRELLQSLHTSGFRQAVGSSAPRANVELILQVTNIADYFSAIVASEETTNGKPHPEVFLNAAMQLRVPPQCCVVIEDAVAGVQAAKAGGMKCIAVTFVGHHPEEALRAAGADWVVENLQGIAVDDILRVMDIDN